MGDSGDELGDGSVRAESRVEMVVVGDESADSKVEAESRRTIGDEQCELGGGRLATFTVRFGDDIANPSPIDRCTSTPFPKTDMKDGSDASNDWELVVTGIFRCRAFGDRHLFVDDGSGGARALTAVLSKSWTGSCDDLLDDAARRFGAAKSFANRTSVGFAKREQVMVTRMCGRTRDNLQREPVMSREGVWSPTDDV